MKIQTTKVPVGNVASNLVPVGNEVHRTIPARHTLLSRREILAGLTVLLAAGVAAAKNVADDYVFEDSENALPDEKSFSADEHQLLDFLRRASPAELRRYHSNRLLDLLNEHRPGAWRYAVLSNATCVVFIRDSDGISRPSEGFEA